MNETDLKLIVSKLHNNRLILKSSKKKQRTRVVRSSRRSIEERENGVLPYEDDSDSCDSTLLSYDPYRYYYDGPRDSLFTDGDDERGEWDEFRECNEWSSDGLSVTASPAGEASSTSGGQDREREARERWDGVRARWRRDAYTGFTALGVLRAILVVAVAVYIIHLTESTREKSEADQISGVQKVRPVGDRTRVRPVVSNDDEDRYYGFSDTGSEFVVRAPEPGDVYVGTASLEGLAGNPVEAKKDELEESVCEGETLVMVPAGAIQAYLGFLVLGEGKHQVFKRGNLEFTARFADGHFWFDRNDTHHLRWLLGNYWRCRKGLSKLTPIRDRASTQLLGKLRLDFDKSEEFVHNLTRKMSKYGLDKPTLLKLWDNAGTVSFFAYSCKAKLIELRRTPTDESTMTGGPPNRVSFHGVDRSRPVRHAHVDIPISHFYTHRPKLWGCPICDQGKATLTAIKRKYPVEGDDEAGDAGRTRIDADHVGKQMPLSSDGHRIATCMQSTAGHFWILPLKNKSDEQVISKVTTALSKAGIQHKDTDLFADKDFTAVGEVIVKNEGNYNPGISNRANSHAAAENCVKNGLGALRTCSLQASMPQKDWTSLAKALTVNLSREIGNKYIGNYIGPLFIPGETSHTKLEVSVYEPPITHGTSTKIQFMFYGDAQHGVVVEFYDVHQEKRRRTEVTSEAFERGLPADRPQFGYGRMADEKEPLATYIQGLLDEMEKPIEIPKARELRDYEKKKEPAAVKAKAKPIGRPKGKAKAAAARKVENKTLTEVAGLESDVASDGEAFSDWYQGWDDYHVYEKWAEDYDFTEHDLYLDLGQSDAQDFDENRSPMETSIGETARVCKRVRPGRDSVRLTKVLKPREIHSEEYNHLDWPAAYEKERKKMFEKFNAMKPEPVERDELEDGCELVYNFGVHTVKDFDVKAEWKPGYRLVGAGNQMFKKVGGKWVKAPTVIDRQKDVIESATIESTRLFMHCQKIRKRKIRKDDADGAYLQAPQDKKKRPNGLFASLPECMWPVESAAWAMRNPVWEVDSSLYGVDNAGFSWDVYSHERMAGNGFHRYDDLSQSLYDSFPEGTDLSMLKKEGELLPEEMPVDNGCVSKYVDDFLSAEDPDSGVYSRLVASVKFKVEDHNLEYPEDLGRYVGSVWEGVNSPPDANGVYKYAAHQIEYVKTFVDSSESIIKSLNMKSVREADTPAIANDSAHSVELDETPGVLAPHAASIVCALLYVARSSRPDVLFAVCRLTRYLTKWMVRQDMWLCRLIGYLKRTMYMKLNFRIHPDDFAEGGLGEFENWADADLGGDKLTKRSTSGGLGLLVGPRSRALVYAHCKRQGQTGISTPESETVAMVTTGKKAIPFHMTAQRMLKRALGMSFKGDNSASERVIGTGVSAALAYMKRTAELSLTWAKENMAKYVKRTPTDENLSDIFTKPLELSKFDRFRTAMGVY